jgi:hypothetical protein
MVVGFVLEAVFTLKVTVLEMALPLKVAMRVPKVAFTLKSVALKARRMGVMIRVAVRIIPCHHCRTE